MFVILHLTYPTHPARVDRGRRHNFIDSVDSEGKIYEGNLAHALQRPIVNKTNRVKSSLAELQ